MAETIEQLRRRNQELKQQRIDAGYDGEEYGRWQAREPKVPRRLALGCYEELQPLYEFLVAYAQKSAQAGKVLDFDISRLDVYYKYILTMRFHKLLEYNFISFEIDVACQMVKRMLNNEISFHSGMELLFKYLKDWGLPSHLSRREQSRAYQGEHFEALVDRYFERITAHIAEGKQIASENLKKRGETNE